MNIKASIIIALEIAFFIILIVLVSGCGGAPLTFEAESRYQEDTEEAMTWWNEQFGTELVRLVPEGEGEVRIFYDPTIKWTGEAWLDENEIHLNGGDALTIAHEIGHMLGLDHSKPNVPGGIMNRGRGCSAFERCRLGDYQRDIVQKRWLE